MPHHDYDTLETISNTSSPIPVHGVGRTSRISTEVVRNRKAFFSLREEWNSLTDSSPSRIYQTFEWQWTWWKHFGDTLELHIVLIRQGEQLIGIFPLFLETSCVHGRRVYRRLRMLGSDVTLNESSGKYVRYDPSDYLDIIASSEHTSEVVLNLLAHFYELRDSYDEIDFPNLPDDGIIMTKLIPELQNIGLKYDASRQDICPRLNLPGSVEEYLLKLSQNTRHRLRHARKTWLSPPHRPVQPVSTFEEVEQAFNILVSLHQKRWNRLGFPGLFYGSRAEEFLKEVAKIFFVRGNLWLKTARHDGNIVAVRMGFKFKDRMYDYLSGFDIDSTAAKLRPGLALILAMIEDAAHDDTRVVDFLRGEEQYKFDLTSDVAHVWRVVIRSPGYSGRTQLRFNRLYRLYDHLRNRWSYERELLEVQYHQHGIRSYLFHYLIFRADRIRQRVRQSRTLTP
ncbi:MAG TPA: GNAT family N-acetyltransferase [Bacteroidota bacterium]|jgi:CelD/BcsL family acetyltransferase involved in cellulose biosynthesis|nr:GNAT family N-acetyltransferase [Bacteroidota bacterium]